VVGYFARAVVGCIADGDPELGPPRERHLVEAHGGLDVDAALVALHHVLERYLRPDDAVAVAPLLVGHVGEAAHELGTNARAEAREFRFETVRPAYLRPHVPYHLPSSCRIVC
jgi:hypothetical protein